MIPRPARSVLWHVLGCVAVSAVLLGQYMSPVGVVSVSAGPAPSSIGQNGSRVTSVREHGAKGDGTTNDTHAIQAAIDAAPNGSSIYFPAGTYLVDNLKLERRVGLRLEGDGKTSVIKRLPLPGNTRHATITESTDLVITKLAFDANGIERYGGVNLYSVKRVRIENTWFYDSRPQPPSPEDRYAFVFGIGSVPSEDITIANNQIEDLQLEVDQSRRVRILDNTVTRPYKTAGIGIFTVNDGVVADDYLIARNRIIDPIQTAFAVHIDPPTSSRNLFRRIRITDNTVIRKATAGPAITVGTPNNSMSSSGNVFEDITIVGNSIEGDATPEVATIFFNTSGRASFEFKAVTIKDNAIRGTGSGSWAIDARSLRSSLIESNAVSGVWNGITMSDALGSTLRRNTVRAGGMALRFQYSRGSNRIGPNTIQGSPQTPLELIQLQSSDVVVK